MAGDDLYLNNHHQLFDMPEAMWELSNYNNLPPSNTLRTADGPFLQIMEQPKQRGFRFRYGCEGPSHGGLPGATSEKNRKSFPAVKVCNYQGPARIVVQLVTANPSPAHLHAHSLVGKQCDKGICIADLPPKDSTINFPNLGILHVTKKNVHKTLEERMTEALRMGYNNGVSIHPEIDIMLGEVRSPRELTEHQRSLISSAASHQSKDMDLSVVRLMFTAFLPNSDGGFSRRLDPVVSDPIYDSKAPNASNLKIVRMDRTAGCVSGGEEVYLLCDKVQKDDILVRFYEEDETGMTWEAMGDFSPTDVHRQFAIVFKTPKYRDLNLQKSTSVFVQLKRKSDNETSDPKPFTYYPLITDKEEVQRKRQKTLPNFGDFNGAGGGGGHGVWLIVVVVKSPTLDRYTVCCLEPPLPEHRGSALFVPEASQEAAAEDCSGSDGESEHQTGGDPGSGAAAGPPAQQRGPRVGETEDLCRPPPGSHAADRMEEASLACVCLCVCAPSVCEVDVSLLASASRQVQALYQYALTGDPAYLLAPQRPLLTTQDQDGDTGLHLGVIHSQGEVVRSLAQVLSSLPGEDILNKRNHLYQTPLHLAVITQQKEAIEALLLAGADATLTDRHGNTPLHLASQQGGGAMVATLLRHTEVAELVDLSNLAGLCALHLAVLGNSLSAVRDLLGGGASVETAERSSGRTALHLATELDNVSLAGCLLLEGNADVNACTYNGSTPLHVAVGRTSVKLTALLMAAGADPHKENFEPLYYRDEDCCEGEEEEEEDEGYIPGTTPLSMAAAPQVLELLNGKEYRPEPVSRTPLTPQGDLSTLAVDTKRALCAALEGGAPGGAGGWERLAHTLGLGLLVNAFRLSPRPARTLLDSYEVSGGTIKDLAAALQLVENRVVLGLLQGALLELEASGEAAEEPAEDAQAPLADLKLETQNDSGVCDSGVELSTL
ncbi:nuclear factor NF-kappa-B p105 subunit [Gadus chalcogrammus]|uniref:nuclear factor NF-kappa-B p105 subunit n=1 Tax=Gadus chalcogrammus TaxID=1042646 RepID=UPI0024C47927|nr:nuclear factor NF-kappa-B p105 subunit [Gadus chalcogrammus]